MPRTVPFTLFSIAEVLVLHLALDSNVKSLRDDWIQPHPFLAVAMLVASVAVLRYVYLPSSLCSLCAPVNTQKPLHVQNSCLTCSLVVSCW